MWRIWKIRICLDDTILKLHQWYRAWVSTSARQSRQFQAWYALIVLNRRIFRSFPAKLKDRSSPSFAAILNHLTFSLSRNNKYRSTWHKFSHCIPRSLTAVEHYARSLLNGDPMHLISLTLPFQLAWWNAWLNGTLSLPPSCCTHL